VSEATVGTVTLDRGNFVVTTEPHIAIKLKRLFKKSDKGTPGVVKLSATPENARELEWVMQRHPLELLDGAAVSLPSMATQHRETTMRVADFMRGTLEPGTFNLALPPRSYQAKSAAIALAQGHLLDASDVGLGKTLVAIAAMSDPKARPAVVVTLTHLPTQWEREIWKFCPDLLTFRPKTGQPEPMPTFMGRLPDVVILNYHKLAGWAQVLSAYAKTLVLDEAQEIRHDGTTRYGAVAEIAAKAKFRIFLSATPIFNYGDEIRNVFEILKPGSTGTRAEFLSEWCVPIGQGKHKIKEPRAFGSWAREEGLMLRHTRKEVGRELPPVSTVVQHVESDPEALEKISGSAGELARIILNRTELSKGDRMRASEELQNMLRQATGIAKAPYVAEFVRIIAESGEKVVLVGWHRAVYDIWAEKLKDLGVAWYTGSESPAEKEKEKGRFLMKSGKDAAQILLLSLRSGAGLNDLQDVASIIVYGELDWSPWVHHQTTGRIHRDGQLNGVMAYYLVSDVGSDPVVSEVLGIKRAQGEGILDPKHESIDILDTSAAEDRIKRLAEAYLAKKGEPMP